MSRYCTKCNINWAALASQDTPDNNESYDFCPRCLSDRFLVDQRDGDRFVMNMFNGVVNVKTWEPLMIINPVTNYKPVKPFDRVAWEQRKEAAAERELKAIDAYITAWQSGGQQAGEIAYRQFLNASN